MMPLLLFSALETPQSQGLCCHLIIFCSVHLEDAYSGYVATSVLPSFGELEMATLMSPHYSSML